MANQTKISIRTQQDKHGLLKFWQDLEFKDGSTISVPINQDGSIRWFDDSKLIKREADGDF